MIHQKIAYQNFMLYEKSVTCHQCHSGIHMDKLQVVYLCVCIHMHVEFFACKHRFIIMLMPLNDKNAVYVIKIDEGKNPLAQVCFISMHTYSICQCFATENILSTSLPNFLPQKSVLCGTAYRYTL